MASYSGAPLPKKLGIKEGHQVALIDAPTDFELTLGQLPEGVTIERDPSGREPFNVILCFAIAESPLRKRFAQLARCLVSDGGLWIAWPKKASGVETNLSEAVVRAIGLNNGLVDNKVCAVDDVWSGLRFVNRLKDRPSLRQDR